MVEAHGPGDVEFGVGRLIKEFLDLKDLPCDEIARALIKRVAEYAGGGEPEDDRTVVVIKRHPHAAGPGSDHRRSTGSTPIPKPA
jgi:serine phosphatase RsbU (regulator of sigma subunit)